MKLPKELQSYAKTFGEFDTIQGRVTFDDPPALIQGLLANSVYALKDPIFLPANNRNASHKMLWKIPVPQAAQMDHVYTDRTIVRVNG